MPNPISDAELQQTNVERPRSWPWIWATGCMLVAVAFGCGDAPSELNADLLQGRAPYRIVGVYRPELVTDARTAFEGSPWDSPLAAPFGRPGASLSYDLGRARPLFSVLVQLVGPGSYSLEASVDCTHFARVWTGPPDAAGLGGLRAFRFELAGLQARCLRLQCDAPLPPNAVAELAVFDHALAQDAAWPFPRLTAEPIPPLDALLARHAAWKLGLGVLCLGLLGLSVHLRQPRLSRTASLGLALIGVACWTNVGEFHGAWSVHYHDAFHYYMGARYASDLHRDGLYDCALQAELENGMWPIRRARHVRDLATNRDEPLEQRLAAAATCRARFDSARWQVFRADVRFFQSQISPSRWAEVLDDHGYNASPLYTLLFGPLFEHVSATPGHMLALSLIDPALYALGFAVLGWAFGVEVLAFALLVFGLGFPWVSYWTAGGLGRAAWFAISMLGLAACERGRPALAGGLIGLAGALQLLPLMFLVAPAFAVARGSMSGATADPRRLRLLAGAAAALVFVVACVLATEGPGALSDFVGNTFKHAGTKMENSMGMGPAAELLGGSTVLRGALSLGLGLLVLVAGLRVERPALQLSFGALWPLVLVDVTSYYYVMLVLLVPWAARDRPAMFALLGSCLASQLPLLGATALPGRDYYVLASGLFVGFAAFASTTQFRRRYIM